MTVELSTMLLYSLQGRRQRGMTLDGPRAGLVSLRHRRRPAQPGADRAGVQSRLTVVSRHKLCLPASISDRFHAMGGSPLPCLYKIPAPKLAASIEAGVVPAVRVPRIVDGWAMDLTVPDPGRPCLNLVFDREGWSPDLWL